MEKYIGDDIVTLKLAGLRYIKKEDWGGTTSERYCLKWNYKGADGSVEYKDKQARDAMYAKVLKALTEQ